MVAHMRLRSILPLIGLLTVTFQKKMDWCPSILKLTFLRRFFSKRTCRLQLTTAPQLTC